MKEFSVTIERNIRSTISTIIKANTEDEARYRAIHLAVNAEDSEYSGRTVEYHTHIEEVENNYIDRYGNPYDSEDEDACWPAGGGLHKDCKFNADALYAYYVVKNRWEIARYLTKKGFKEVMHDDDEEVWVKGNTQITYECYPAGSNLWGYMHTELIEP